MFIQTEVTSDPARMTFLPGREVLPHGTLTFDDRAAATRSPLAARLFGVRGVAALALGPDYITITKESGDWQHLKPALLGAMMEHFLSGAPVLSEPAQAATAPASEGTGRLVEEITQALRQVIDPELGYNIVDLGLIYHVGVDTDGVATVTMTTTSPGCPATGYLSDGARERAASVEGITRAEVTLTYEPRWSTDLMSDGAKAHFGIGTGRRR